VISSNDFRPGVHVLLDGEMYAIIASDHVKVGRGPAYVKAKIRSVKTGATIERTFRAGERVPHVYLERKTYPMRRPRSAWSCQTRWICG